MNELNSPCDWLVLVNPTSGDNKGQADWGKISSLLQDHNIEYHHRFTDYAMHGVSLVKELVAQGCQKIIVCGGDGFLNEVINGLFTQNSIDTKHITLGMIPVGTGNDWFRSFYIPFDYDGAIQAIKRGKTIKHDIGRVYYQLHGEEYSSYFINMCGIGFDAEVAKKVNVDKGKGHSGPLKYQYHLFTSLVSYNPTKIKIMLDGVEVKQEVFSMTVGIGQYNGGGMKQLPSAKVDDGLFDLTIIKKISRLKVVKNVKRLYDGSFIDLPEVLTLTGKEIVIESEPQAWIEVDGESLGHTPFRFEIIPNAISVITNI